MMTARQPSRVQAHCTPRLWNICLEKSGNPAAIVERSIMLAATADAALSQVSQLSFRCTLEPLVGNLHWKIRIDQIVEARKENT